MEKSKQVTPEVKSETIELDNLQAELAQLRAMKDLKLQARKLSEAEELKKEIEAEKKEIEKLALIEKFEAQYGEMDKKISMLEMGLFSHSRANRVALSCL